MKKYLIWFLTLFFCTSMFGQNRFTPLNTIITHKIQEAGDFPSYDLLETDYSKQAGMDNVFRAANLYQINPSINDQLLAETPESLELSLKTTKGDITLQLTQHKLFTDNFTAVTSEAPDLPLDYAPGLYYRGIVDGDPNSFAAISIFQNEIIAMAFPKGGEAFILGKVNNSSGKHIGYYETDLIPAQNFSCGSDVSMIANNDFGDLQKLGTTISNYKVDKCVRVYLELEYDLVTEKGGATGAMNFMSGLFNVVATLYQNENITTFVSKMFVWTTPDSYATGSTKDAMVSFRSKRPSFDGDLAHLVSRGAPTGGGIAWVNSLCTSRDYAYSWIGSSYNGFPTYSWAVNVVAHEMGHNLGSRHTHACVWNGNNTAIDGCGPTAGYPSNPGGCSTAAVPAKGKGTVMSYCHLLSTVGIGFTYGFGPQPGALIRSRVANAGCLKTCNNCPNDLILNGSESGTKEHQVVNDLTSTQTLSASSNVDYKAGNLVIMKPGFIANTGADFRAYIGTCTPSLIGDITEQTAFYDEFPDFIPARMPDLPAEMDLRCMPNPFDSRTTIEYRLTYDAVVDFYVFDINGRILQSFNIGDQLMGVHRFEFVAEDLPPGVYYLKMHSDNTVKTTKMVISR